ncbi:hypothetical protein [Flavobacterium wongokense]|uniref:hypothetical protein n=1 Tax=Flavobacterium wongokense TaxID=2910674 RepID=UPI001F459CD9|nr:hypothetical protein [Flavobacterium sp. WG47]MCF6133211.1 hypothetical protein [Flavobacterium sp. WG47]
MKKLILIFIVLISTVACKSNDEENAKKDSKTTGRIAFDWKKWQTKEDKDYPYRNDMIDDLIASDTIKKLSKAKILSILGEPDRIDNNYFFYQIDQERIGSWPITTKTLVIKIKNDETVEWVKIHG